MCFAFSFFKINLLKNKKDGPAKINDSTQV
jgi:hypothetical protein